jgi:hypothetical protein
MWAGAAGRVFTEVLLLLPEIKVLQALTEGW